MTERDENQQQETEKKYRIDEALILLMQIIFQRLQSFALDRNFFKSEPENSIPTDLLSRKEQTYFSAELMKFAKNIMDELKVLPKFKTLLLDQEAASRSRRANRWLHLEVKSKSSALNKRESLAVAVEPQWSSAGANTRLTFEVHLFKKNEPQITVPHVTYPSSGSHFRFYFEVGSPEELADNPDIDLSFLQIDCNNIFIDPLQGRFYGDLSASKGRLFLTRKYRRPQTKELVEVVSNRLGEPRPVPTTEDIQKLLKVQLAQLNDIVTILANVENEGTKLNDNILFDPSSAGSSGL